MSERSRWHRLRTRLLPYGRLVRVENSSEAGTPDVCYCLLKVTGWFELKYLEKWPERLRTPVRIPSLTLDQVNWLTEWEEAGGIAHLLLTVDKTDMLLPPSAVRLIYDGVARREMLQQYTIKDTAALVRCLIRSGTAS